MIRVLAAAGALALAAAPAVPGSPSVPSVPSVRSAPPAQLVPRRTAVDYDAPLPDPIVVRRRFEPPPTPYSAGHRGVDLAARAGQTVLAAADGLVRFAGDVAGRGLVVLAHRDGVRTEYEPVTPLVSSGAVVRRGTPIGTLAGDHHGCAPDPCLHWGARRDDRYLDPLALLRRLGPVRLLPWTTELTRAQARG